MANLEKLHQELQALNIPSSFVLDDEYEEEWDAIYLYSESLFKEHKTLTRGEFELKSTGFQLALSQFLKEEYDLFDLMRSDVTHVTVPEKKMAKDIANMVRTAAQKHHLTPRF